MDINCCMFPATNSVLSKLVHEIAYLIILLPSVIYVFKIWKKIRLFKYI